MLEEATPPANGASGTGEAAEALTPAGVPIVVLPPARASFTEEHPKKSGGKKKSVAHRPARSTTSATRAFWAPSLRMSAG